MAKYSDFLTYCVFGFLATLVNMGTYHLLYDTVSLSNVAATVLAWFTAVTFAFLTNKFIVFKNRGMKVIQIMRELAMFYSARLFTGIIDVAFMFITVDLLTLAPLMCKFISNISAVKACPVTETPVPVESPDLVRTKVKSCPPL